MDAILHSSKQSRYRTPLVLVQRLHAHFPIGVDLAADPETTLFEDRFLGPGSVIAEDALTVSWAELFPDCGGFLNPPYSKDEMRELRRRGVPASDPRLRALQITEWARKAFNEAEAGFTTIGLFPYSPQTEWFRWYVMGHSATGSWRGFAALDYWRIPHRVSYLDGEGHPLHNAGVNSCIIHWGPNPGFVGPWIPSGRYWSYR